MANPYCPLCHGTGRYIYNPGPRTAEIPCPYCSGGYKGGEIGGEIGGTCALMALICLMGPWVLLLAFYLLYWGFRLIEVLIGIFLK